MTGQSELFPQSNEFIPTTKVVELLFALLNLQVESKVLVVEFGFQASSLVSSEGHKVIQIRNSEGLAEQISKIEANSPYDGAIILPSFSGVQANIQPPEGWTNVRRVTTEDSILGHAINSLQPNGSLTALVPNGLLSNYGRQAMRKGLVERGLKLVAKIPYYLLFQDYKDVQVSTALIVLNRNHTDSNRSITFVDEIHSTYLPEKEVWKDILSGESDLGNVTVRLPVSELKDDVRLDPQYYDPVYLQIKPPYGFVETSLGEIAELRGGFMVNKEDRSETIQTKESLPYLQVRHILSSGEIADKLLWVDPSKVNIFKERLAKPGDILVTVSGTVGKAAMVPRRYAKGVFFDTSIRRVRIYPEHAKPEWVLQFFQSEVGQLQFRRLTSGTAQPQITTPDLESMPIFLPVPREEAAGRQVTDLQSSDVTGDQALARLFANAIQENVVEYLRNLKADDPGWKETIEKALRSVIAGLGTKPLEKVILEEFPTPIAIPYRRFQMARYNHYERLDRMVSLVESCVYFVFHVLVADICKQGWLSQISLSREARQAFRGIQSIDYRLKFINEILEAARNGSITLFMPELVNIPIVKVGDTLRDEVRNPVAHSAPGSEPYVRSLIEKYTPSINELLESLKFLNNYTLCRIRSHYYQNGTWRYQSEIYKGAEYDVNLEENRITEGSAEDKLIKADCDHLVVLSPDNETLDLHPFYQLYFGDETARESHLCFYKCRQGNRLVGESIRSSVEVTLLGIEDFQTLTGITIGNNDQNG